MSSLKIKKGTSKHSAYDLRDPNSEIIETHTLAVIVTNESGVLARVIGLFSGRGYNIHSLTVAEIDHDSNKSRITVVTTGTPQVLTQIKAQLSRMIPVFDVHDLTEDGATVERELALFSVTGKGNKRVEALRLADIFRANVVDTTLDSFIFELTGTSEKVDAFLDLMRPLGLTEIARTGTNIVRRALREINETIEITDGAGKVIKTIKPLEGIGYKRLFGFTTTVAAVPAGTAAAFSALYDVTQEERDAIRRFAADWSKNSTLLPIRKEDGTFDYTDEFKATHRPE